MSSMAKLEMMLEAVDRASGPMRKVERAIGSLEEAALDAAKPMNAMDDALDAIQRATKPLGKTEKALDDIERAAQGIAAPLDRADRALGGVANAASPLARTERALEAIERAAHGLASPLASADRALDSVARSAAPLGRVEQEIEEIGRAARAATAPIERMERAIGKAGASHLAGGAASRFVGPGAAAGAAFLPAGAISAAGIGYAGAKVITTAADFESALTEIQKKAGLSAEATAALGAEIKALAVSGEVAVPLSELASAYERGAASGIGVDQLREFAVVSAKASDAFGMTAEEVGNFQAKLERGLGMSKADIYEVFDLTNSLADAGIADESGIVKFMDNAGASLKTLGLAKEETLALGATLLNIGMPVEVASTGMGALSSKLLTVNTLTGKTRKSFQRVMGPVDKFAGMVNDDANGALLTMLDTLAALDKTQRTGFLKDFVGAEWTDEVLRLVEARGELRKNLTLVNDPAQWAGSLDKSYALKLDDFWSQWRVAMNAVQVVGTNAGDMGLPALTRGLGAARDLALEIDQGLTKLRVVIDMTALEKAQTTLLNFSVATQDALTFGGEGNLVENFFTRLGASTNVVTGIISALEDAAQAIGLAADDGETATDRAARYTAVLDGLRELSPPIAALTRGIGAAPDPAIQAAPVDPTYGLSGLTAGPTTEQVPSVILDINKAIGAQPDPNMPGAIDRLLNGLSEMMGAIGNAIVPSAGAAELPKGLPAEPALPAEKGVRVTPEVLPPDIVGPLQSEGAAATMEALDIGRRIQEAASVTASPVIDVSSIVGARAQVDALAAALRALPSPGAAKASIPIDGARATGGPVGAGGLYLVGEEGPELFSPGRSGMIHTAAETSRFLGAEPRTRPDLFSTAAASGSGGGGGTGGGTVTIDASLHVGAVHYGSPEDKEEFETLLRRHARTVSDVVAGEKRRQDRLQF